MNQKLVLIMALTLLTGMLNVAFNVQPVKADGTIYIRADGSIDPPTALIYTADKVTYTFTADIDISDCIAVERDNIVIDGAGYTVQGAGYESGAGIGLSGRSNVTIKNMTIKAVYYGIVLYSSSNSSVSGNNITDNSGGIYLGGGASNNKISGNNITDNWSGAGIFLDRRSSNNKIYANNIIHNQMYGVELLESSSNTIYGNNIANNTHSGIRLAYSSGNDIYENQLANHEYYGGVSLTPESSNNTFYHNNFFNNAQHVRGDYQYYLSSINVWDEGYPSGGNYWDNYTGIDLFRGLYQNETGSDGIGDTAYVIDANNRDRYPLMSPWTPPEHELIVSITASTYLQLDGSSPLAAIVTNQGLNDEVNVELSILINGTTVDSKTVPFLKADNSYTLSYLWTPTVRGKYNVTAYARPVPGETSIGNNQESKFAILPEVGVNAGDWIKITYTITGWPAGQARPEWLKVEFLTVEGTSATVLVSMHLSDGTEQKATVPVDVVAGGQVLGLSGLVIPANLATGDSVYITGYGNITIADETQRTYAGASRTVVHANFSQYGTQLYYYWDKQTGVMVEASTTSGYMTATAKATETNMWQAAPIYLYILVALAIIIVVGAAVFIVRRRKKTQVTTIKQKTLIPATPDEVYDAFMEAKKHSAFTGSKATSDPKVGGEFTAWDGYISGRNLELVKGKKIVQEWSTTDWPDKFPPSRLELTFKEAKGGTEISMIHSNVPAEQANDLVEGWNEFYMEPMKEYFTKRARTL